MKRKWLSDLREQKGLTQSQVAVMSGVHRTTYGQYESGYRTPKPLTAQRIAVVLGFDWSIFFTLNGCESHQEQLEMTGS